MAASQEPQSSSFSFTQGFLLGQASIALLIFAFIKFFIFGDPPPAEHRANLRSQVRQRRALSLSHRRAGSFAALRHKRSAVLKPPQALNTASILAKTYYNVSGHQPESLDWFNVLIAQTIAQLRADAQQDDAILGTLQKALNGAARPDWLEEINITEVSLGEEFPIFSNCRVIPVEDGQSASDYLGGGSRGPVRIGEGTQLQAHMDVDLSDVVTLGIETKLTLNYPKPRSAVLPVALAVSVVRFSGTLSLSFVPSVQPDSTTPSPSTSTSAAHTPLGAAAAAASSPQHPYHPPTSLTFTFLPDYRLDLSIRSLLGSRARLTDVPKIAQLIEDRIHAWFDERVVEPRFQQIVLPSLWPRKQTARGPEKGGDGDEEDDDDEAVEDSGDEGIAATAAKKKKKTELAKEDEGYAGAAAPRRALPRVRPRGEGGMKYAPEDQSLEARMEREGERLREAEVRGGEQWAQRSGLAQGRSQMVDEGLRRRGHERQVSVESMRSMPGAMPA